MKHFRICLVLVATFLLLGATACRAPADRAGSAQSSTDSAAASGATSAADGGLKVRVELDGTPKLGVVPVVVYVLDGDTGVSGATVKVTGDMTHAGMAPVLADAVETEPGLYRADAFAFTMAGDWIITTDVGLADGDERQVETSVTVPGN